MIGLGELQERQEEKDARRDFRIKELRDAMLIEGPNPRIHRKEMSLLKKNWPTLYNAIWNIVNDK